MNPLNDSLDRLFRAAAQAPRENALTELSFGAQARVLAAWRSTRPESFNWLATWLRAGLAAAALVTLLALGLTWSTVPSTSGDEYAVADATLYVAVAP